MRSLILGLWAIGSVVVSAQVQGAAGVGGGVTQGAPSGKYYQPENIFDPILLDQLLLVNRGPILIHIEDLLHISLYGVKEFDADVRVERDGSVPLPYLGNVEIAGLTVSDAERKVGSLLISKDLVLQPAVTITLGQQPSNVITVNGEVARPGSFPANGDQTLDRIIASSGGFLSTAAPEVELTRKGFSRPIRIPLGPDPTYAKYGSILLLADDKIQVPRVGIFYIVGAVKTQGAYPLKALTPTTVVEAIATAGGVGYEALLDDAMIVRTEGDRRVLLKIRAGRMQAGKARDVALLSDDILFIPTSKLKAAIKGGAAGLIVSLASTYIYAHP